MVLSQMSDILESLGAHAAYVHIPKDERRKLDSKACKCIFLGYSKNQKGYRLYDQSRQKIIHSRDVTFNEASRGIEQKRQRNPSQETPRVVIEDTLHQNEDNDTQGDRERQENETEETQENEDSPAPIIVRRSLRETRRPDYYGVWVHNVGTDSEPTSVTEALSSSEKEEWKTAMNSEIESIKENNVWELVELPEGKRIVGSKWVFKRKIGANGVVERYKARLVAQGFSQRSGIDYDETFCPVVRFESLRTLIALAVQQKMKIHQMDITSAFLNGKIEEEVYMKQPQKVC